MLYSRFCGGGRILVDRRRMPDPGPEEVLIRVRACAISAPDVVAWRGGSEVTPGSEAVGEVVELGDEAGRAGFSEGARVAVHRQAPCGECALCRRGRSNLCRRRLRPDVGIGSDGGYAEFMTAHVRQLLPLDDSITWDQGAMLLETVGTAIHALRRGHVWNHPERVENALILGAGPAGLAAASILAAVGITKRAVLEAHPYRRAKAREMGAAVYPPLERPTDHALIAFAPTGFDLVYDATNDADLRNQGFRHIGDGGTMLMVGENNTPFSVNLHSELGMREKAVIGSEYFPAREFNSNESLVSSGRYQPERLVTHAFPLEDISEAFETYASGESGAVLIGPTLSRRHIPLAVNEGNLARPPPIQ